MQKFWRLQLAIGQGKYNDVCIPGEVHVTVPNNVKLRHLSKMLIFKAKIVQTL